MARSLTVLIKTIEEKPRSAGLEINTGTKTWKAVGSAADIFQVSSGTYIMIGATHNERACILKKAGDLTQVASLRGMEPDTVPYGASGTGIAAMAFHWTADRAVDV